MTTVRQLLDRKDRAIFSVEPEAPVLEAIRAMAAHHVGALLVMQGATLCGIVSERDYARNVILMGRSSADTPLSRKLWSTPRRSASHAIVSTVGRVLPRSICEMYSLEKRSPASWPCVRPAPIRSWRRRSPSRGTRGEPVRAVTDDLVVMGEGRCIRRTHSHRYLTRLQSPLLAIPQKGHKHEGHQSTSRVLYHLTEALDRCSQTSYSEPTLHRSRRQVDVQGERQ